MEWRKDATGAYVDIRTKDVSCNKPYFEPEQTITDSEGNTVNVQIGKMTRLNLVVMIQEQNQVIL